MSIFLVRHAKAGKRSHWDREDALRPLDDVGRRQALALAEGWLGAAQGRDCFMAMVVGSSVAGGIVLNGQLLDGAQIRRVQRRRLVAAEHGRRQGRAAATTIGFH